MKRPKYFVDDRLTDDGIPALYAVYPEEYFTKARSHSDWLDSMPMSNAIEFFSGDERYRPVSLVDIRGVIPNVKAHKYEHPSNN